MKTKKTQETYPVKPLKEQIRDFIEANSDRIEELEFGNLTFEVREGKVYRLLITSSVLVRN